MEQKTIPYDCQKDILTFLSKLAQFAEVLAKILPVLFSLSLIPGFLTIIIYGMILHCLLIQDLARPRLRPARGIRRLDCADRSAAGFSGLARILERQNRRAANAQTPR
jgi:hypothetical protein